MQPRALRRKAHPAQLQAKADLHVCTILRAIDRDCGFTPSQNNAIGPSCPMGIAAYFPLITK